MKSKRLGLAGHVAKMGETRNAKHFGGKLLGKRPLGTQRRRWQDNINTDLSEVGCETGRWMEIAYNLCPVAQFRSSGTEFSGSATC